MHSYPNDRTLPSSENGATAAPMPFTFELERSIKPFIKSECRASEGVGKIILRGKQSLAFQGGQN